MLVRQAWPETVISVHPDDPDWDLPGSVGRVQAWVAGPGMGTDPGAVARLTAIVRTDLPVLVDADGLTILSQHRDLLPRNAPTLITPHAGELARLLGAEPGRASRRGGSSTPAGRPPSWASPCCSRAPRRSSPGRTAARCW